MNRIKELRKKNGKSQQEIADFLHVNRTTIVKWETGKHNPDVDTFKTLADYFNVSIDYLSGNSNLKINSITTAEAISVLQKKFIEHGIIKEGEDLTDAQLDDYLKKLSTIMNAFKD